MTNVVTGRPLLWTITLRGGKPVSLALSGSPSLDHDGNFTLWKAILTSRERTVLEKYFEVLLLELCGEVERGAMAELHPFGDTSGELLVERAHRAGPKVP